LEDVLKAKSDTLSQNISDLRQKVAGLEVENKKLKEDIAVLQKIKEEKVKEVSNTYEQLLQNMKSEIAKGQVTISELKGKLTVNMEAAILFDSGSADVKDDGLEILLKMVETLKSVKDKAIRIEGHTDNVQISGGLMRQFPTNWELSAARAINVAKYLQQQGVDPAILSAAAYAEYKPVADNSSKEGRAKNRRIEITLVAKD
jgi:chemotaxis protein MotB